MAAIWTPNNPSVLGRYGRLDDWRDGCCELGSLSEPTVAAIRTSLNSSFLLVLGNTGSGKSSLATALTGEDPGRQMLDEICEASDLPALTAGLERGRVVATSHIANPDGVRSLFAWMRTNSDVLVGRNPYVFNVWRNFGDNRQHRHLVAMALWPLVSSAQGKLQG